MELCAHYHCVARPCQVRAGNQKGRGGTCDSLRARVLLGRSRLYHLGRMQSSGSGWRDEVAHQRPWPGDDRRTVAQAFAEEQPRLMPLPLHPFNTDLVVPIRSAKTIYVRFDLNDYSIPPRPLAVRSPWSPPIPGFVSWIGTQEIARHRRSYDRHQPVLDPAASAGAAETQAQSLSLHPHWPAGPSRTGKRNLAGSGISRGESAGNQTAQLLKLLDLYGAPALRRAVREALERNTPRASSVAFLLRKRQQTTPGAAPMAVDLSRHPEVQSIDVQPHDLETYDELARHDDDPDE